VASAGRTVASVSKRRAVCPPVCWPRVCVFMHMRGNGLMNGGRRRAERVLFRAPAPADLSVKARCLSSHVWKLSDGRLHNCVLSVFSARGVCVCVQSRSRSATAAEAQTTEGWWAPRCPAPAACRGTRTCCTTSSTWARWWPRPSGASGNTPTAGVCVCGPPAHSGSEQTMATSSLSGSSVDSVAATAGTYPTGQISLKLQYPTFYPEPEQLPASPSPDHVSIVLTSPEKESRTIKPAAAAKKHMVNPAQ